MKTTLYLHRPSAPVPRTSRPSPRSHVRPSIVRLGVLISAVAAVAAVVLDALADVPAVVILVPVVVVGSALSWHASGRPDDPQAR
jgi:hypothetical protein